MTADVRYGISASDPRVNHAVDSLRDSSDEVLRSLYCAVFAFTRDTDPQILVQFAEDAAATARLYSAPGHDHHKALATTPSSPAGSGRGVREVFVDLRG